MSDRTRNLLHKSRLRDFAEWAKRQGYQEQTNLADFQVLRLRPPDGSGILVFYAKLTGDHVTAFGDGTDLVRKWIRERDEPQTADGAAQEASGWPYY
jgi:hypothetical protein